MNDKPAILWVDDEQKVLDLAGFRIKMLGYRVMTATSGEDALSQVAAERPDLIILDITMPGMDGVTVCSRLKKSASSASIPVLMMTARSDVEDVNRAMAAGADAYMVKPYYPSVLQMKIFRHLKKGRGGSDEGEHNS